MMAEKWDMRSEPKAKRPSRYAGRPFFINAGDHLISHTLTRAVPSAQRGLTSVFGMGTGVTLAVWSPANLRMALGGTVPAAYVVSGQFLPDDRGNLAPFNLIHNETDWVCFE